MLRRGFFCVTCWVILLVPLVTAAQSACVAPPGYAGTIHNIQNKIITYYVPIAGACTSTMQGCVATSCPGLKNNSKTPTCLDAVRLEGAKYVTIASAAENYGKYYHLGTITYRSAIDNQMHTVHNVVGYVHDTGCAFNGTCSAAMRARYGFSSVPRPDKLDVCTTVCANCTDAQASALAAGKNVSLVRSTEGVYDPVTPMYGNPRNPYSPVSVSPYSGYGGARASQGVGSTGGSQAMSTQGATSPLSVSPAPVSSLLSGAQGGTTNNQTLFPNGLSAGSIFVQPARISRGSSVLISWTSVNMKSSCSIIHDGTVLAQGSDGSKRITISPSASGSTTFALECLTAAGETHRSAQTIPIQ